jgi:hypothetical protein
MSVRLYTEQYNATLRKGGKEKRNGVFCTCKNALRPRATFPATVRLSNDIMHLCYHEQHDPLEQKSAQSREYLGKEWRGKQTKPSSSWEADTGYQTAPAPPQENNQGGKFEQHHGIG